MVRGGPGAAARLGVRVGGCEVAGEQRAAQLDGTFRQPGTASVLATLRRALLADGTEAEFLAFLNTLEPDEILDAGGEEKPGAEGDARDRSMPVALQDRFIRADPGNPFDVHTLGSSHPHFLVQPREAAALLAALTGQLGSTRSGRCDGFLGG